jgi:hypothetical protein
MSKFFCPMNAVSCIIWDAVTLQSEGAFHTRAAFGRTISAASILVGFP